MKVHVAAPKQQPGPLSLSYMHASKAPCNPQPPRRKNKNDIAKEISALQSPEVSLLKDCLGARYDYKNNLETVLFCVKGVLAIRILVPGKILCVLGVHRKYHLEPPENNSSQQALCNLMSCGTAQ